MTSIHIGCVHPPSHPPRNPGKQTRSSSRWMLHLQTSCMTSLYVMVRHTKKQGTKIRHNRKVTSIYTRCVHLPPPSHTPRSPENKTHTPGRSSNALQTTCTPFSCNVGRLLKRLRHQPSDTHDMTSIYIGCVHPPSHPPRNPGKQTLSSSRWMLHLQTSCMTSLYVMVRYTKKQGTKKRHTRKVTSIYTRCVHLPPPSHTPRSPENKTQHTHPCPSSQEHLVVGFINRNSLTLCCLQIAALLQGQTKEAACKQHI